MARMEFLRENLLNTTTQVLVTGGGTGTILNLFDRSLDLGYETVNASVGSRIISVVFDGPTVVSHILLQNHNMVDFSAHFNSTTASSLFSTTGNSATSTYHSFATQTVNSVQIQLETQNTNTSEKQIGELVISERRLVFERNPSTRDFTPRTSRTRITHKMPDGGISIFNIKNKFKADLKWKFITTSFKNSLFTEFDRAQPIYFLSFPTTTAWDGQANEVLWSNDFDFKHDDNSKTQGFGGKIRLEETSNA